MTALSRRRRAFLALLVVGLLGIGVGVVATLLIKSQRQFIASATITAAIGLARKRLVPGD